MRSEEGEPLWKKLIVEKLGERDNKQKKVHKQLVSDYEKMMCDYLQVLEDNVYKTSMCSLFPFFKFGFTFLVKDVYNKVQFEYSELKRTKPQQEIERLKSELEQKREELERMFARVNSLNKARKESLNQIGTINILSSQLKTLQLHLRSVEEREFLLEKENSSLLHSLNTLLLHFKNENPNFSPNFSLNSSFTQNTLTPQTTGKEGDRDIERLNRGDREIERLNRGEREIERLNREKLAIVPNYFRTEANTLPSKSELVEIRVRESKEKKWSEDDNFFNKQKKWTASNYSIEGGEGGDGGDGGTLFSSLSQIPQIEFERKIIEGRDSKKKKGNKQKQMSLLGVSDGIIVENGLEEGKKNKSESFVRKRLSVWNNVGEEPSFPSSSPFTNSPTLLNLPNFLSYTIPVNRFLFSFFFFLLSFFLHFYTFSIFLGK